MAPNNEEFNTDELEAPAWMDSDFLTKVLRNCEENSSELEVKSFRFSPATVKGDHYASVMFRANVEYRIADLDKSKSMIIKTMPEIDGHKKDMLDESYIFETEIGMYTEVLPRFEQILRDVGDDTVLKAPCLYHQLSPRKLIVFEDIVPLGYQVLRDRLVNEEEVKAALVKLAKWHAISHKVNIEEPHYFDQYRYAFMSMPSIFKNPALTEGVKNFITAYKSEPNISKYIPYFEKLEPNLLKMCRNSAIEYRESPQPKDFYVLCHGDFHIKNMMFKHNAEDGKLEDVLLLDFQFTYIGPIVLDLIYAVFMLLNYDMRENFPAYLHFYLTNFNETLKKIGYEGPMLKIVQLREQLMRHKHLDLFLLATFMPIWHAFKVGDVDPNEMMTSQDYRLSLYKNSEVIKELERLLPTYEHLGYFEDC